MHTPVRYVTLLAAGALIALLAIVAGQGSAPTVQALYGDSDGDTTIDVAEVVLGSNPHDTHSTPEDSFTDVVLQTNLCADGVDNDGDGLTDGDDGGCTDPDRDLASTATEALLGSDPNDGDSSPEDSRLDAMLQWLDFGFIQTCADGLDNDGDGLTDAAEPTCVAVLSDSDGFDDGTEKLFGSNPSDGTSVPEHETPNAGSCSDGIDNDRDGMTDRADDGCTPLTNDMIGQATVVGALPFEDSVKVSSAGVDPGEPRGTCYFDAQLSIWYKYTATANGVITVDTAGTNFTSALSVFTRSGSTYTEVSCAPIVPNRPFDSPGAHATIHVTTGETYYIQAIGYIFPGLPNRMRLLIDNAHPPANDSFSTPRVITTLPFTESLNTVDATRDVGEPRGRCVYQQPNASVWYRFTPASDTRLIANTTGSSYGTAITAWTDSLFGPAEVGCTNYDPRLAFSAEAGRTYYVQVSSQDPGGGGALRFGLSEGEAPGNDNFVDATSASSLPFDDRVDIFSATRELGEPVPTCGYYQLANTIWYTTTAQQTGYLKAIAETSENSPGVILGAYHGSSPSELTEVACANPYGYETTAAVPVTAGETYYFQIGTPLYGGKFVPTFDEAVGAAGVSADANVVTFDLEPLVVPSCAPSELTFADPLNDAVGGFGPPPPPDVGLDGTPDVTSVSGGSDGTNYCLRVEFAGPLPAPSTDPFQSTARARIEFDTDENINTGYGRLSYDCGTAIGSEVGVDLDIGRSILVPLDIVFSDFNGGTGGAGSEQPLGFATYSERSFQVIVPLDALGGETHMRAALAIYGSTGYDCVPNAGVILSPQGPALGDVNCDGATNSLDSALVLQRFAAVLFQPLPCEYAGDVNQNGSVGPVDAVLILQYDSGMIQSFSPASG